MLVVGAAWAGETAELFQGSTALAGCLEEPACSTAAREIIADALRDGGIAAELPGLGTHAALSTGQGLAVEVGAQSYALPPGASGLPPGGLYALPVVPRLGLGWIAGDEASDIRASVAIQGAPPVPLGDDLAWSGGLLVSVGWGTPDGRAWMGLDGGVGLSGARGTLVLPQSLADTLDLVGTPRCRDCVDTFSQVHGAFGSLLRFDFDPTTPLFLGLGGVYSLQTVVSGADRSTWTWQGLQPRARLGAGYRPTPASLVGVLVHGGLRGPATTGRTRLSWTALASVSWRFGPTVDAQGRAPSEIPDEVEAPEPERPALVIPTIRRADHPALSCGSNRISTGSPPPGGLEAWCVRISTTGQVLRDGAYLRWHDETTIAESGEFLDDQRSGLWTEYDATGQVVVAEGPYLAGARNGPWKTWYPTGELASEGSYLRGKEQGVWVYWSKDGIGRTEGAWTNGRREGVWTDFGPDGQPTRERVYRGGRLLYTTNL